MANAAQKKLAASNAQTIKTHRYAFVAVNLTFILIRLIFRRSSSSWSLYFMYILTFALAAWLQFQLESMGQPTFDAKGGVVKTGNDLGQKGLTEYMFDILYLTWGIQLLVAFTTTYAWWLYLLIPGYAGTKIWELYKGRGGGAQPATPEKPEKPTKTQKRTVRR